MSSAQGDDPKQPGAGGADGQDNSDVVPYETPDVDRPSSAEGAEAVADAKHDPYAALRLPGYRLYAMSFILAIIGGQAQAVALQWQIYQKTHSALSLGWLGGIQVIPLFAFALYAGHLCDIFSRTKILLLTQLLLAFWSALLAALAFYGHDSKYLIPATYGLVFLNAVTLTFARPARASLLPTLVPHKLFPNAVTWNSSMFEVSSMVGPAFGGFVIAMGERVVRSGAGAGAGVPAAYLLNAVLLLVCFVLTLRFPNHRAPRRPEGGPSGFESLFQGLRFVFATRLLLATMTLDLFAVLLGGAVYLLPIFAKDILHVGSMGFGWLRAAPSIGAFSMALVLAHAPPMKRAGRNLLVAVAGFGVATIVFGISRSYWLSFAMLVLTGVFDNISVVVRHSLVQLLTPDHMRGRVSAVNQVFIGSSNELGGFESGITARLWGAVTSVVVGGIGTLGVVLAVAIGWPQVRRIKSLHDAKAED